MPILTNARHELFAQEVAQGSTADAAYAAAGYRPDRGNATHLNAQPVVRRRIMEIQNEAAEETKVSIATQTDALLRIAAKAEASGEVSGLAVARAAHMDVAKLNGLVVDKKEVRTGGLIDELTADERRDMKAAIDAELRRRGEGIPGSAVH